TLAYSERLHLKLSSIPPARTLGVCHFQKFYTAMDTTRHIVPLGPSAVELVDRTMIGLARDIPAFRKTVDALIKGDPEAILLVEFSGEDAAVQLSRLKQLTRLMGDLGLPGSVVEIADALQQKALWEVRKAGLNIMMSMKGDGKPVSFIEDCAVPLEHLADYTQRLTDVFTRHGTRGTWYAHASVGTLHVRPILDMRREGAAKMRAIAEEASAIVREYKGAYSGEHGDGQRRRSQRRLHQGRRDVQQQRPLPKIRRRYNVSLVPRDTRRGASDARPGQHAAARLVRPARRRSAHFRRSRQGARSLR